MPYDTEIPVRRGTFGRMRKTIYDTFDDPSTAWRTPAGEWRMIGHCGDGAVGECGPDKDFWQARMWGGSRDFRSWRYIGLTNLPAGECTSMYPLPPLTPGTGRGADGPHPGSR